MNKIKALLQNEKLSSLIQFIKFGLVGVSNTAISYGIEMLCYYVLFKNTKFIGILNLLALLGISTDGNNVKIVITTRIFGTTDMFSVQAKRAFPNISKHISKPLPATVLQA